MALRKKGRLRVEARDLDTFGELVKTVRIGLPSGSHDAPTSASSDDFGNTAFLLDNYASWR